MSRELDRWLRKNSFIEKPVVEKEIDYSELVPLLHFKVNENVRFKGKRVEFEDMIKFVKQDETFYPRFYVDQDREGSVEVDMLPFLCVGIAELICLTMEKRNPMPFGDLTNKLMDSIKDKEGFCKLWDAISDGNTQLGLLEPISSFYVDYRFPSIQGVARKLYITYLTNPALFFDVVLSSFSVIYEYASLFCYDVKELSMMYGYRTEKEVYMLQRQINCFISEGMLEFGALSYKANNRDYSITDCRGISIYSTLILMFCVYEKFGVDATSKGRGLDTGSERNKSKLQEVFASCIGTDTVGLYLSRGKYKCRPLPSEKFCLLGIGQNTYPLYGDQTFAIDGVEITREAYEGSLIFKKAFGVDSVPLDKMIDLESVRYYGQVANIWGSSYSLVADTVINDHSDIKEFITGMLDSIKEPDTGITEDDVRERVAQVEATLTEKHSCEVDKLSKRIEELERILESKSNIISQMTLELADANEKMHSFFTDDVIEETLETEVSIEEMVDFLKDYHLVMVGGRFDLPAKLCSYGLRDVVQIDEETPVSRLLKADFFVINTQFISHKIVRMVESQFPEKKNEMFYYNGTNIENLITMLYNSISAWMEKE